MPDPSWTMQYNWAQAPEGNGFTRRLVRSPVITEVISGNPAARRVEINSDNGNAIFLTSQVPALDAAVGVTAEAQVRVSGAGDAGFELTFLNAAILVNVYENLVNIYDSAQGQETEVAVGLSNAVDTLIRMTFAPDRTCRFYRNGVEIHSLIAGVTAKPFQRVLWWGEDGGTQVFNIFRYYSGGPVPPG